MEPVFPRARYPPVPEPIVLHLAATRLEEPSKIPSPLAHTTLPSRLLFSGVDGAGVSSTAATATLSSRDESPLTDIPESEEELPTATAPSAIAPNSPVVLHEDPVHVGSQRKIQRPKHATRFSEEELGRLLATTPDNQQRLKGFLMNQISKHLDPTKTITFQDADTLSQIKSKATTEFPFLNNFVNGWMLDSLLTRMLSRTSQKKENKEIRRQQEMELNMENIAQQVTQVMTRGGGAKSRRR